MIGRDEIMLLRRGLLQQAAGLEQQRRGILQQVAALERTYGIAGEALVIGENDSIAGAVYETSHKTPNP